MRRAKRAGAEGEGRRRKFFHWWGCYATDGAAERAPTRQGLASGETGPRSCSVRVAAFDCFSSLLQQILGAVEQFQNPPIQEALLDIQVTLPANVTLETLKQFHDGVESRFPEK